MNPSLNKMIINKDKLEHSKKCYDILYPEFKLKDNKVTKSKDIFLSIQQKKKKKIINKTVKNKNK